MRQVRSILQHAWAEIEHDLGYKSGAPIPAPIRRRFSRLAGLLEIGDSEFAHIRDDLATYAEQVTEDIQQHPSSVGLDDVSLKAFIASDPTSIYLDNEIAMHAGAALVDDPGFLTLAEMVQYTGIQTIEELQSAMEKRKEFILKQYKSRVRKGEYASLNPGEMEKAFEKFHIGLDYKTTALEVFNEINAAR